MVRSGPIADAPSESWAEIESALEQGYRRLQGGSSLAKVLLEWADSHYRSTGKWPRCESRPIYRAPGGNMEGGEDGFGGGSAFIGGCVVAGEGACGGTQSVR
jgi:hypothetical protein